MEAARLLSRDPVKYARGVSGIYLLTVKDCELGQIARASFFFFRNQDDILDGDRTDIQDPLAHVLVCREQIESGKHTGYPKVVNLAQFAIEGLDKRTRPGDNPRQDFLNELDIMLFDYHRAKERRGLTKDELQEYYRRTFFPVVNIMLIGLNSGLRAEDIEEFSFCQSRVYTVRDLDDDWNKGIINIPCEVLQEAKLTPDSSVEQVKAAALVRNWFCRELNQCQQELPILEAKLAKADESLTTRVCMGLVKPLYRLSRKYLTQLRD